MSAINDIKKDIKRYHDNFKKYPTEISMTTTLYSGLDKHCDVCNNRHIMCIELSNSDIVIMNIKFPPVVSHGGFELI